MYSLFLLLFKKSYWRMLLRKATWFEAWLNLRRAHKDKRARKHLLQFSLLLLIPAICIAYTIWLAGSGALFLIPFVIPVIWWRSRREKQDSVPLRITPSPEPVIRQLSPREHSIIRLYFAELALTFAVMLDRAGSEAYLREKFLPDGFEVTSRRVHLDLLKAKGIWERMAQQDREMIMIADGHWDWDQINQVALGMEPLRLLRWILRIDFYLPVIGQQLKSDYRLASDLVNTPQKVLEGKELADVSMMRVGQEAAHHFFFRCLAEAIHRRYYDTVNEEDTKWATDISTTLSGKQHEDLVLGDHLVSEATKDDLLWAISLSRKRTEFLTWTMSVLEGDALPELPFRSIS